MLSWGWNAHRNTSNSDYGRFDFGYAGNRSPANGFELRQGNNTNYIHQIPYVSNNGFHTNGCPHASQYFPHQRQPGCQNWSSPEQDKGDASSNPTPKFTIQVGNAEAAAAFGGNVNHPGLYQCKSNYYVPESSNVSESGGNTALNYKGQPQDNVNVISNSGDNSGFQSIPTPTASQSANELGRKPLRQMKKSQMREIPINAASVSAVNIQRGESARVNKTFSPYHLCGRCTKCKNIQVPNNGPPTAVFPSNKVGGSQKFSTQNFMHLEGKNFKATAMGRL